MALFLENGEMKAGKRQVTASNPPVCDSAAAENRSARWHTGRGENAEIPKIFNTKFPRFSM